MKDSEQMDKEAAAPRGALRKCLVVFNERGLNARAAAMLVRLEKTFDAQLFLECGGRQINARSIMQILSLDAAQGSEITVCAEGPDAETMIQAVEQLFAEGFSEKGGGSRLSTGTGNPGTPPGPRT